MRRASWLAIRRSVTLAAFAVVVAGCGAGVSKTRPTGAATSMPTLSAPSQTAAVGSGSPGGSAGPAVPATPASASPAPASPTSVAPATIEPSAAGAPGATPAPSASPSVDASSPVGPSQSLRSLPDNSGSPAPSVPIPSGSACSGTAENRDFFAAAAQAVQWPVYCAVVPTGWFVESGSWQLRNGGRLTVTYKGPAGAHLVLDEGTFCTTGVSVCTPHDHELGQTAFGDRVGQLVALGPTPGDGFAIYVNPGTNPPSWSATATSLDQATFVAIAAGARRVTP